MLPTIKKGSDQLRFYEFRGSEDITPIPNSGNSSRMPHKFSATQQSDRKGIPAFMKKGSSFNIRSEEPAQPPPSAAIPVRYTRLTQGNLYRSTISEEIKEIEKKIRRCQRKIREDKQRSLEDKETVSSKKEYEIIDMNRFDFLTNPGAKQGDELEQPEADVQQERVDILPIERPDVVAAGIERLGLHYSKDLRRKFQRREMMPHKACKRKIPNLYITQQTNALQKAGKPVTHQEHLFRVMTREVTPQEIYPTIPAFPVVRDNISKNVLAYLSDYRPFIDKTKQAIPLLTKAQNEMAQAESDSVKGEQGPKQIHA